MHFPPGRDFNEDMIDFGMGLMMVGFGLLLVTGAITLIMFLVYQGVLWVI